MRLRGAHRAAAVAAAVLASAAVLCAGTVVTNEGKAYTGKVTVTAHVVTCVSPGYNRTFALPVIREIILSGEERAQFEIRKRKLPPLDAEAHHQLGMWLKARYRHGEAQTYFRKAVTIDPDHEGARTELGEVRDGNAWKYSPVLHRNMVYDWVGREAVPLHLGLARQLLQLKRADLAEKELRRVLQSDQINATAIAMIRPLIADYKCRNRYRLPFTGTWQAISGPTRYGHGGYSYMLNAWDFRKVDEAGRFWSGPPTTLKNHLTFEQPVYACADGEVYEVRDRFPDNPIGTVAPLEHGNRVLIRHAEGERSVIGHLQKGSVVVKVGDKVTQGQLIGRIGNSGRSGTPHIHFAIFDEDGISLPMTFIDFDVVDPTGPRHVETGPIELGKVYDNRFEEAPRKPR